MADEDGSFPFQNILEHTWERLGPVMEEIMGEESYLNNYIRSADARLPPRAMLGRHTPPSSPAE